MIAAQRRVLAMLLAAGFAGCSEPTPKTRQWSAVPAGARREVAGPTPLVPVVPAATNSEPSPTNPAPDVVTNVFAPTLLPATDHPGSNWVVFAAWSEENHLGTPQRLLWTTNLTYELSTTNGVIALAAWNNVARYNGKSFLLGHAPQFSNGNFLVHSRDAAKSVMPLAKPAVDLPPDASTVVIDAGHGGENAGTRAIGGNRFEKEFTLDWALLLKPLLESNGWQVVLTRTNDVDVSLADRVAVAENVNAALFISLHFNSAFPRQEQSGIETFCLTPTGLPSTLVREFEDDPTQVFPNNAHDEQNLQLAMRVHSVLVDATGASDRGVRRARFMGVLRGQKRPAILIEGGYLSNPREAELIASPEYRRILAEAVAKALPRVGASAKPREIAGAKE